MYTHSTVSFKMRRGEDLTFEKLILDAGHPQRFFFILLKKNVKLYFPICFRRRRIRSNGFPAAYVYKMDSRFTARSNLIENPPNTHRKASHARRLWIKPICISAAFDTSSNNIASRGIPPGSDVAAAAAALRQAELRAAF